MRDSTLKKDRLISELDYKLKNLTNDNDILINENVNLKE